MSEKKTANALTNLLRAGAIAAGGNVFSTAATGEQLPLWARLGLFAGSAALGSKMPLRAGLGRGLTRNLRSGLNQAAITGGGVSIMDMLQRRNLGYSAFDPKSVANYTAGRVGDASAKLVDSLYSGDLSGLSNQQLMQRLQEHASSRASAREFGKNLFTDS